LGQFLVSVVLGFSATGFHWGVCSDSLRIHFFDVGQGDATLIEAPTGQRVLVDAGPDGRIVEHLRSAGVDTIDLFIASHNHADHIGGAVEVLRSFPVRYFMDNGIPHTTDTYLGMLETLRELDIPLLEPERRTIRMGEVVLDILPPPGVSDMGQNDNSVGVIVHFGEFRASLAGDAEARLWQHWILTFPELLPRVQVHKASHHGSRAGDVWEAMERLRPQFVVVSSGSDNQFGHPHSEALALYESFGAMLLLTAELGTIMMSAGPDGVLEVAREAEPNPITKRNSGMMQVGWLR
jgi:competence protein ComEC